MKFSPAIIYCIVFMVFLPGIDVDKPDRSRPKSEAPTGPTVAKMMSRLQNSGNGTPKPKPRDLSPKKVLPEKPVVKRKSFTLADGKPVPVAVQRQKSVTKETVPHSGPLFVENEISKQASEAESSNVVQKRTQMFEGSPSLNPPTKPTPPIKPRSRPPSSNLDEEQKSPKHKANDSYCEAWDIKNKGKFEMIDSVTVAKPVPENSYCEAWDLKKKKNVLEKELEKTGKEMPSPSRAPPKKPPRTGAHDEYMRTKLKSDSDSSVPNSPLYDTVAGDEEDSENEPVYREDTERSNSFV